MSGQFMVVGSIDFLLSLGLVVVGNLLFSVNDLLGRGTLFAFAAGRYYEPRIEERALLFIDMRSSTAIAERLGELGFLNLLNFALSSIFRSPSPKPSAKSTIKWVTRSSRPGGSLQA